MIPTWSNFTRARIDALSTTNRFSRKNSAGFKTCKACYRNVNFLIMKKKNDYGSDWKQSQPFLSELFIQIEEKCAKYIN